MITFGMKATSPNYLSHLFSFHLVSVQPWRLFCCIFLYFRLCLSTGLSCFAINCEACLSVYALNLCDVFRSIIGCLPPLLQVFASQFCIPLDFFLVLLQIPLSGLLTYEAFTAPSVVSMPITQTRFKSSKWNPTLRSSDCRPLPLSATRGRGASEGYTV